MKTRGFLLKFVTLLAVYYALTAWPWFDFHVLWRSIQVTAKCAWWVLERIEPGRYFLSQNMLTWSEGHVCIQRGCDPCDPIWLFCAGVLAFPASWRWRLIGLVVGSLAIFTLNLARIVTCTMLLTRDQALYYSVHQEWWPALLIFLAMALWLGWSSQINQTERK